MQHARANSIAKTVLFLIRKPIAARRTRKKIRSELLYHILAHRADFYALKGDGVNAGDHLQQPYFPEDEYSRKLTLMV